MTQKRVVVVGAGVMGLWSALILREMGHDVLLLDAWPPGHSRATSGDESRVIRCGYGGSELYAGWARRSLAAWEARGRQWGRPLLVRCGVLWLVVGREPYARRCLQDLERHGIAHERLDRPALSGRYPQIRPDGIRWALLEPDSGALLARASCLALLEALRGAGGSFALDRIAAPDPALARSGRLEQVLADSGRSYRADEFLFACGPWLPGLFPGLLGRRIRVTLKEVYYFGTPAGDDRFLPGRLPVWTELGTDCYGLPSIEGKGFKMHPDRKGRVVDPTRFERRPTAAALRMARTCLKRRFPDMAQAPVVETRICQYEQTADDHMIFDRHPAFSNVWLAGGGSGHCFKHGPAIGEMVAGVVSSASAAEIPDVLRLAHAPRGRNF